MSVRNGLLGLGAVLAMTGAAAAEPPINPLVEGREPNPVAREFYESEPATFGYGSGPVAPQYQKPSGVGWWAVKVAMGNVFDQLMRPVGTTTLRD